MEPDFPRASGFAHGRGSHEVPLRADRGNGIRFLRHDDGRFRDHDFGHHGNPRDKDERHHHHFFNDFGLVAFGLPFWWYPGYRCVDGGYPDDGHSDVDAYNDSAPAYGDEYWQDLAMKVQWVLSQRGYYDGPIDGMISPDGTRAIRALILEDATKDFSIGSIHGSDKLASVLLQPASSRFQEAQRLTASGPIDPQRLN